LLAREEGCAVIGVDQSLRTIVVSILQCVEVGRFDLGSFALRPSQFEGLAPVSASSGGRVFSCPNPTTINIASVFAAPPNMLEVVDGKSAAPERVTLSRWWTSLGMPSADRDLRSIFFLPIPGESVKSARETLLDGKQTSAKPTSAAAADVQSATGAV
jgi:hypothetical protein